MLVIRKFLAAWTVTFILVFGLLGILLVWELFKDSGTDWNFSILFLCFVFLFAIAGNLIYALPISLMAEKISEKVRGLKPFKTSLLIHIAAGLICFPLLGWFYGLFGCICCILFFFVDHYFSKIPKLNVD
ncbi:hypothetical protein ACOJQI_20410 [Bacillus salacetis]|uniref:hypothetical protein n=1 Tax=Bacillus salacetis TaxID=2315464 RepID=UPI003B9ECF41